MRSTSLCVALLTSSLRRETKFHVCVSVTHCLPVALCREIVARQPHGLGTDVWSLGCMLYTFFTGHPPFDVNNSQSYSVVFM